MDRSPYQTLRTNETHGDIEGRSPQQLPRLRIEESAVLANRASRIGCASTSRLSILAVFLVAVFALLAILNSQPISQLGSSMPDPSEVRSCTFDECERTGCDPESAPFMCVEARIHIFYRIFRGGCSSTPWLEGGACASQCDIRTCHGKEPGPDDPTCRWRECPEEWCFPDYEFERCGTNEPFRLAE